MTAIRKIVSLDENYLHLEMPDEFKGKKVEVIIFPVADPEKSKAKKRTYDFSDISGKMKWKGDAVSEQRKLRDEW